jgi:hypothetical protein
VSRGFEARHDQLRVGILAQMSDPQPKISIIITCFNYQAFVGLAIESAIGQTYKNTEIIVVDDGSTDDSPKIIGRYTDRIHSIRQENSGYISAYNRGYAASHGDIIIFLDADDLLMPITAEEVARVWCKTCVKVQYDLAIIDGSGNFLGRRSCNFLPSYNVDRVRKDFQRYGTYRWPVTSGNGYSRWFLELIMPLTRNLGPDGMLNTIAPIYGDVITLPQPLAYYRIHGSNIWTPKGADFARIPERINNRLDEIEIMRAHARMRNKPLPSGNVLDHEIAFINYRLMALKLGQTYNGMVGDSPFRLWWRGIVLLAAERLPVGLTLAHAIWLSVLVITPRSLVAYMIWLRFNRAAYLLPVQTFGKRLTGR